MSESMYPAKFLQLAPDDGIWLYETSESQDLVKLLENPGEWVKRVRICPVEGEPERAPVLLDNFVVTIDVATSVDPDAEEAPTYVIDGIENTGVITVRMSKPGSVFPFKSNVNLDALHEKLKDNALTFAALQEGQRVFIHLHLGTDLKLRSQLLSAAIEDPAALANLYNKLEHQELDTKGNPTCSGKRLNFTIPRLEGGTKDVAKLPKLSILVQGAQSTWDDEDACNVGGATSTGGNSPIDTVIVKAYM